jgi:hypothetical protein
VKSVEYADKIAVVVREDLLPWQKLNVTAFTASGIAGIDGLLGEPYRDADGNMYLPMLRQPVMIYTAPREKMGTLRERALRQEVRFSVYTEELFETSGDEANRAAVLGVPGEKLNLVGMAFYGERKAIDKVVKGLSRHE